MSYSHPGFSRDKIKFTKRWSGEITLAKLPVVVETRAIIVVSIIPMIIATPNIDIDFGPTSLFCFYRTGE